MTIRKYIADISNSLHSINIDDFISPKWIYYKTISVISDFLKKDNQGNRLLYKISDGWSEIEGIPMIEVPISTCGDIDTYICEKLMKTKYKLPEIHSGKYGDVIKQVASDNFSQMYERSSPREWKAIQKREFKDKTKRYYFFINDFLYIPIPKGHTDTPQEVRIEAYFKHKYDVWKYNNKHNPDCPGCDNKCIPFLDYSLVIPSYLEDDVKKDIVNQIAGVYLKIQPDDNPNMSSQKNSQQDKQNAVNGI